MAKTIVAVSSAQVSAAKAMVRRSAVTGRPVSSAVHKIANAPRRVREAPGRAGS